MKKRVVSALLAALLCVGLLAACGSKDNKNEETTTTAAPTTAKVEGKEITAVKGVKFNVPESWKGISDKDSIAIFSAEEGVKITISNMENDAEAKRLYDMYLAMAKIQGEQTAINAEIITVGGKEGVRANSAAGEVYTSFILVPNGDKIFSMVVLGKIEQKDTINKDVLTVTNSLKFV